MPLKKNILILCDFFPPAFAPRMGYLCKNLQASDWKPTIITEYIPQEIYPDLADGQSVTYIHFFRAKNKFFKKIEWLYVFIADFFFNYKEKVMEKAAQKEIDKNHFSILLTSSYRTFPLVSAEKLSRKNKIPLMVDLRDIVEQYVGNEFIDRKISNINFLNNLIASVFRKKLLRLRNQALKSAAYVTTISEWHVDVLKQYNRNVQLIYNGYDSELFYPQEIQAGKFNITYTGRIISLLMRDPSLLFEAVSELGEVLPAQSCRIRFYVDERSKKMLQSLAKQYNIENYIDYFDYISASDVPRILSESSVLLLLTNSSLNDGPKGVMTTKFFEYLAVEKPILCVKSDEALLEKAIIETHSGISAKNADEVKEFLLEKYNEWQQNKYTRSKSDREEIRKYSREHQAGQFVSVFESIVIGNQSES